MKTINKEKLEPYIIFITMSILIGVGVIGIIYNRIEYKRISIEKEIEKENERKNLEKKHIEETTIHHIEPFLKSTTYYYDPYTDFDMAMISICNRKYTPALYSSIKYVTLELDIEKNIAIAFHGNVVIHKILSISYDVYSYAFDKWKFNYMKKNNINDENLIDDRKAEIRKNEITACINHYNLYNMAIITTDKGVIFVKTPGEYPPGEYKIIFEYEDLCVFYSIDIMLGFEYLELISPIK